MGGGDQKKQSIPGSPFGERERTERLLPFPKPARNRVAEVTLI